MNDPDVVGLWPWPSLQLPVPDVVQGQGQWQHEDGYLRWVEESIDQRRITVPDEFWMQELLDLDLEDAAAISAFCSTWGMLEIPPKRDPYAAVSVADYRRDAIRLRNVARLVLAQAGQPRRWHDEREPDGLEKLSEDALQRWLVATLNRALSPMHPRLVACGVAGFNGSPEDLRVGLLTAIAVQIFNFVLEKPHVSRCEWPPCGREYVYQRGRSTYGGHKSTARYCSPQCMRAAKQKRYRDKKRKEVKTNDQEI